MGEASCCNNARVLNETASTVAGFRNGTSAGLVGYALCASENQSCSFSGTKNVAYGANGKFNYKTATNGIACNNATFGDPIVGVVKACYVRP